MKGMNKNKIRLMAALWVALAGTLLAQPLPGTGPTRSSIKPWLKNALGELAALKTTNDLKVVSKRITLSYIDPTRATQLLALHGYTIGKAEEPVDHAKLPVVISLPGTTFHETIPKPEDKFPQTETDPMNELIVFHDENEPAQLSRLLDLLKRDVDKPAKQIIIEAMILEISSTALEEMGVKWARSGSTSGSGFTDKTSTLTFGTLKYPSTDEALNLATAGVFHGLNAQIKALVREGKAEVLSRPSVLALNNRMAFINVSKEIPVANTTYAPGNNYQRTSFEMKKAGISLAVRPRASADGSEVSMQINAMVTAQVPNEDVEVKQGANVVAKSPTISVREVKTTARVANNTPFIIGGLIARDKQSSVDKVPILGDLPLLGGLFRSRQEKAVKREVIIVITPTVLPDNPVGGKHMPKDEDFFDSFGNQLFRDAYRIRAEDTFDLNYLTQNRQLQRMKALASRIVADNVQLSGQYPYNHFVGNAVPGEEILCYRQIYEVLKRQDMQEQLASTKIIFFEPDKNIQSGHRVRFLEEYLRANAPGVLTEKGGTKAVAISFTMQRFSDNAKTIFNEPVPELTLVDCTDEANWARQLWALNQPTAEGQEKFTVLLRHQKDLQRLKYAVLMKKTVELNTEKQALSLSNFTRGRLLLMPRVKEADIELVDGDVARAFFFSEMYYQALQVEMEKDLAAFRKVIEDKNHLQQMLNPNPRR
jgi:general secretion pathway protein D